MNGILAIDQGSHFRRVARPGYFAGSERGLERADFRWR